jgi:type IV secretory pathway VirB3-like protein
MWVLQGFGLYAAFLTVMGGIGTLVAMREISKQDDQRLNQLLLRWRDALYRRNRSHWNAHSMSPIEFDRRSN